MRYQGASVGRGDILLAFFFPNLVATTVEVVPWRQYFARMIGQKAASSGPGESGSGERVHAARRGSEGGQMLTPQPHAPIQWGWMYGENNGSKPMGRLNRVPSFSFFSRRCAPSRYLFLSLSSCAHPPVAASRPSPSSLPIARLSFLFPVLSFFLFTPRNPKSPYNGARSARPTIFPANIYAAFVGYRVVVNSYIKRCRGTFRTLFDRYYINVYFKSP